MAKINAKTAKYLYNPVNGRVVVNSKHKRFVRPKLIPCNLLDASDVAGEPAVLLAQNEAHEPVSEEDMDMMQHTGANVRGGYQALRLTIDSSEDKGELRQIGADLDVPLTKAMKLSTMRTRLFAHIDKLEVAA